MAAVAFATLFGVIAVLRHGLFLTHAFDTGLVVQSVWKLGTSGSPFSTVIGVNVFADHLRLVLWPLAALRAHGAVTLLVLQAIFLAAGAVPVYLMARARTSARPAAAVAVLYLAHPALQWAALAEVHPEVLAAALLLWAMWAADRRLPYAYWFFVVAALGCREDVAMPVLLVGVVLALEGRRRIGTATACVAVAWVAAALVIMDVLNPYGVAHFQSRYGWLGRNPLDAIVNLSAYSTVALGDPIAANGLALLGAYALPVALVAFARWSRVWLALPVVAAYALSSQRQWATVWFHYGYLVVPLLFYAAVDGAGRLTSLPTALRRAAWSATLVLAGASTVLLSPFTTRVPAWSAFPKPASVTDQLRGSHPEGFVDEARRALSVVPDGESVSATGGLVPHLAERDVVYMFPNPFLTIWYGPYLQRPPPLRSRPTMHVAAPVWVVTDVTQRGPDRPRQRERLVWMLPSRYDVVFAGRYLTVWRLRDQRAAAGPP